MQALRSSGGGIRTRDLRVMSPTSYLTAPPRDAHKILAPAGEGSSGQRTTRKEPRMNGWMRQKYVYVPGLRLLGVDQRLRSADGGPPKPSSPESNWTLASARG